MYGDLLKCWMPENVASQKTGFLEISQMKCKFPLKKLDI